MNCFFRSAGQRLEVIDGFRDRVLSMRNSVSPRAGWTDDQFLISATKKRKRFQRLLESLTRWTPTLDGARVLDVGCGDGANCIQMAGAPVRYVVGIDLHLPLFARDEQGRQSRVLVESIARDGGTRSSAAPALLSERPVGFARMDATRLGLRAESFDVVMSRSAAELVQAIERALAEIARAVRPGGLVYLGIDPFFWLRGCHKRGVVDIPFAHARLTLDEYWRFVAEREGGEAAAMRSLRIATLNRLTVHQWRRRIESMPCEVLEWREHPSELGATVLRENPQILKTLLPGVKEIDLLTERIEVWLRRR